MKKKFTYLFLFITIIAIIFSFLMQDKNNRSLQEIQLTNNWIFAEKQFIVNPNSISNTNVNNFVTLPFDFKELTGHNQNHGTFLTKINVPKDYVNKQLALKIPFIYSAYKVFVNGEEVCAVGTVSSNKANQKNSLQSQLIPLKLTSTSVEISIQVSSYNHMRGGIPIAPSIGDWYALNDTQKLNAIIIIFTAGIIFVAGVLTLLIGLMNRSEKALLIFGFFCLFIATRSFFTAPFIYHPFPIDISYLIATKIEYLTTNLAFICYAIFIYLKFKDFYSRRILFSTISILTVNILLTIFTEPLIFQMVFFTLLPLKAAFALYSIYIIFKASKHGDIFAKLLLFGIFVVFITMIIDHLSGIGIVTLPQLSAFAIAFNVFLVILSLSLSYVKQVRDLTVLNYKLNEVNITLDEKVQQRTKMLEDANKQLVNLASFDSLTNIFNRRSFEHELTSHFECAKENNGQLSFIMLDIDQFKYYNDEYGHVAGDQLLIVVVDLIKEQLPENAIFSRYGGEEFSIIVPNYTLEKTVQLSESIRTALYDAAIVHKKSRFGVVTVSLGVSELTAENHHLLLKPTDLIDWADKRLYLSKNNGRNQTTYE